MSHNKKRVIRILSVTLFICVGFLLLFQLYANIIRKNPENNAKVYLSEVTQLSASKMSSQLNGYFQGIDTIAALLHEQNKFTSEAASKIARTQFSQYNFKDVGIIDTKGITVTSSKKTISLGDRPYFQSAMSGQPSMSPLLKDKGDSSFVYVLATPIYEGSNISGVLYATIYADTLTEALDTTFCDKQGSLVIIDTNYQSILSQNAMDISKYIAMDSALSPTQKEKMESDFSSNHSDMIQISLNDGPVYFAYTPLNFQDWYLASCIDASIINAQNDTFFITFLLFIGVFSLLFLGLLLYIIFTYTKNKESIHKTKVELETVIANIPGGVVRFTYDDNLSIQFLNDSLFTLTGFTKFDIENILENSFLNLVHEDDRQDLASAIVDQMTTGKTVELDCRLKRHNGKFSWFLFKGRMITDGGDNHSCLCVLTDINDAKRAQEALNLSMQRYRIVTEQSESIIFEYNFLDGSIYLSDKWDEKFDNDVDLSDFLNYAISRKLIHPEDTELFSEAFTLIKEGSSSQTVEVRLHNLNDKYTWCRIQLSCVINENGLVCKSIGRITDIDVQKRETDTLKKKAELDSLTGLYNKGTAKMLIDDFLSGEGQTGKHTLMILDIDNFKRVNDSLGHLVGDSVIMDITARMKKLVRASDICGRIGGDEFVVLLKNTAQIDIIMGKAADFGAAFRHTICNETDSIVISGSIGIALYDRDGTNYTELIDRADTALYVAKKRGKDQFVFYGNNNEQ